MPSRSSSSSSTEPLIDRVRRATIGRYDVYAELGSGGMATVYLALDLALDRKVAVKVMSPALADSDDNLERFRREAKVAASLNHPNIIGIHAVGDDPELAYFVMKYVEGRSLDSVVRETGAQSVAFVRTVMNAAGKALHYAHTRGVVHRDVKPANFMLDQDGWLVVTDFGIAKLEEAKSLTVSGSVLGTPYYMAPEVFQGRAPTAAADQYALGVVAFELLTGRQPFAGVTMAEVIKGHLFDTIPSVRSLRPDVPEGIDAAITRMLSKEPGDRFPTLEAAVREFGSGTESQENEVRTQIISLARSGAMLQPQIAKPVSPSPIARTRPPARAAARGAVAEPKARSPWPLVIGAVFVAALGTASLLRPDLVSRAGNAIFASGAATEPSNDAADGTGVPIADSTRADSLAAARDAAAARALAMSDSIARADSITRADSIARQIANDARVRQRILDEAARRRAARREQATPPVLAPPTQPAEPPSDPVPVVPGVVRIGSRIPGAVLYVGNDIRPLGQQGIQVIPMPPGEVTFSIRSERCARWDTTFTVVAGQRHTIGMRPVRC